jgi:hypothetical protein
LLVAKETAAGVGDVQLEEKKEDPEKEKVESASVVESKPSELPPSTEAS